MQDSTSACLTRALAGDLDARAELMQRHMAQLRAFVRSHLGPRLRARESSQDFVQSVLREAWGGFERLAPLSQRLGRSGFRRWLMRTADRKLKGRGRFWSRLRRSSIQEEALQAHHIDQLRASELDSPSRCLDSREDLERLERAFGALPPAWREVVALIRLQGRSHAEAARRLGRTESATRTLLSRALARLATEFEH